MDCEGSGGSFDYLDAYHHKTDEYGAIEPVPDTGCHIVYGYRGLPWEFSINPAAILEEELAEIKSLLKQILETLNKKG